MTIPYSPCSFRQQEGLIDFISSNAWALRHGSQTPDCIFCLQSARSVLTTSRSPPVKIPSLYVKLWKWVGYVILAVRCRSALDLFCVSSLLLTSTRFGTHYDALAKDRQKHLMDFAQQKLLCGEPTLLGSNDPGILACLAVCFCLEFNPDKASRAIACQ